VGRKKNLTIYFFQMKRSGEPLSNENLLSLTKISKLKPFITKQADNLPTIKKMMLICFFLRSTKSGK